MSPDVAAHYESLRDKTVWLLVSSAGIGGAESRVVKVACFLKALDVLRQVNLVVSRELLSEYGKNYYLGDWLNSYGVNVVCIDRLAGKDVLGHLNFQKIYRLLDKVFRGGYPRPVMRFLGIHLSWQSTLRRHLSSDDILHCVCGLPARNAVLYLSTQLDNTCIVEVTSNRTLKEEYQRHMVAIFGPGARARNLHMRCVSETVYGNLSRWFTPGFFDEHAIDLAYYAGPFVSVPGEVVARPKKNVIIFPHRFLGPKNPVLFSEVIKELLDEGCLEGWEVRIRGNGVLEGQICSILETYINSGVVSVAFSHDLLAEFAESKICVSVISTGNSTSNSVYESLKYGNLQVIGDTGITRKILNHPDLYYCQLARDSLREAILKATRDCDNTKVYETKVREMRRLYDSLAHDNPYVHEIMGLYAQ